MGSSRFFVEYRGGEFEGVWVVLDSLDLSVPLFSFHSRHFAEGTARELNNGDKECQAGTIR